jgi:hypothetical protein
MWASHNEVDSLAAAMEDFQEDEEGLARVGSARRRMLRRNSVSMILENPVLAQVGAAGGGDTFFTIIVLSMLCSYQHGCAWGGENPVLVQLRLWRCWFGVVCGCVGALGAGHACDVSWRARLTAAGPATHGKGGAAAGPSRPYFPSTRLVSCAPQTGTVDSLILNAYPPFHALPSMHQIHEGGESIAPVCMCVV